MPQPPRAALEASLTLVRDRKVGGNVHPSMLKLRFISASRLIKRTARDLIAEVLADEQEAPSQWGEQGNALAAVNLAHVTCQEAELTLRIPDTDWTLAGHPDGLDYANEAGERWNWPTTPKDLKDFGDKPWWGTVFENKAPLFEPGDDPLLVELAYRQGLLYLAMATVGPASLGSASWMPLPRRVWHLPQMRRAGQVIVCLTPYSAMKEEHAFPVDTDLANQHLTRYMAKAAVVVAGVKASDPEHGTIAWDSVKGLGLGEFEMRGKTVEVPADSEVDRLVRARADALARARAATEEAEVLSASLKTWMGTNGHERIKVAGQTLGLVRNPGGWRHYHQAPSVSFQTWGKVSEVEK